MKKIVVFILLAMLGKGAFSQDLKTVSFAELQKVLDENTGGAVLINFWATWCKPCIEEMPSFVKAFNEYESATDVSFVFVSVDFQSQHEKVVEKIKELQMKGTLIHLNESGGDWIETLDKNWEGAIPFTILILPDGERIYHYDWFENYGALTSFLDKNLPN